MTRSDYTSSSSSSRLMRTAVAVAVAVLCLTHTVTALSSTEKARLTSQFARHPGSSVIGPRIVGGTQAANGEFPFMVSLQTPGGFHFCGGSVLDATHILTAAHCVEDGDASSVRAVVGRHHVGRNGQVKAVATVHVHPQYNGDNDIAVLTLASAIDMSSPDSGYTPAAIARNTAASNEASGVTVTVAGWGATTEGGGSPDYLRKVSVPMISVSKCRQQYGSSVTDDFICAGRDEGGRDSCQGDSGGPLFVEVNGQFVQTGVVSWGEGCARPNRAGVYSSVRYFKSWIDGIVGNDGGDGGDGGDGDDSNDDVDRPDADHDGGSVYCNGNNCKVQIRIRTDDYPEETSWNVRNVATGAVVMRGGSGGKRKWLPPGTYMLTMEDSYGDGMCCDYGTGRWRLFLKDERVARGGEFEYEETTVFTIEGEARSAAWAAAAAGEDQDVTPRSQPMYVKPPKGGAAAEGTPVVLTGEYNGMTVRQTVYMSGGGRRLRGAA